MLSHPCYELARAHQGAGPFLDISNRRWQPEIERSLVERGALEGSLALRKMTHRRSDGLCRCDRLTVLSEDRLGHKRISRIAPDMRGEASQPCAPALDKRAEPASFDRLFQCTGPGPLDQGREVQPDRFRGFAPELAQGFAVLDRVLAGARIERGDAACFKTRTAPRIEHFLAAARERHDLFAGDTARLEIAVLEGRSRLIAELFDRDTEARHRDSIERGVELPEPVILERTPLPVLALRDIGDDRVEMEVRLLVAVGVVLEQADRKVPGGLRYDLAFLHHPGLGRILLSPVQRFEDGFAVGGDDPLVVPHKCQQRPALGDGEGEVCTRTVYLSGIADVAAVGQLAAQQRIERLGLDLAIETKALCTLAHPLARAVGIGARVVIVRCEVARRRRRRADIGDGKHGLGSLSLGPRPLPG